MAKLSERWRVALILLVVVAWCAVAWYALRPPDIASDWNGWRQTDTQTIANNFLRPGSSVLRPQINWGGDGPGYVEAEFQLYTRLAAGLMQAFGGGAWAAQLVSLIATFATGVVLLFHLSGRYGLWSAGLGVLTFLAARTTPHLATVVMPDALALLGYAAAWTFFCRYAEHRRGVDLAAYAVLGALAMLTKPTTAHLGISSFLLLVLTDRRQLKDYRLWLAWGAMVLAVALYFVHAHRFYTEYGNTFGLLAGEDRKTPKLHHLFMPKVLIGVLKNATGWGLGTVASLVLLIAMLRRRLTPEHWALLVGNAVIAVLALRYMSQDAGDYYFAPASVLGASVVAAAASELFASRWRWAPLMSGLLLLGLLAQGYRNLKLRYLYGHFDDPEVLGVVTAGKQVDRLTSPGDLLIVRSPNEAYDVFWESGRNYHEPRIFYISDTRGWTIGREQDDLKLLADATKRGARFFVDPLAQSSPVIDAWLGQAGELVWSQKGGGRIWRLHGQAR